MVFLSQIAKEEELFSFDDVAKTISEKLVRRHPFVFSDKKNHSLDEQINQWEEIKQRERSKKNQRGILEGIAKNLPSLQRSQKIQKRVASVGFDWPDTKGVFKKIKEELRELEEAVEANSKESIQEEIGDLYMIITNLSEILSNDDEIEEGTFELGMLGIKINKIKTYEEELIKCES